MSESSSPFKDGPQDQPVRGGEPGSGGLSAAPSAPGDAGRNPGRHPHAGWLMPFGICILFVETCLLGTVFWKETPVFWRNEGGYPVWVRSVVLLGFYPVLLAAIACVLLFTASCIREYRTSRRVATTHLVVAVLMWLLLAGVFILLLANNLANLADGRPFHWHER